MSARVTSSNDFMRKREEELILGTLSDLAHHCRFYERDVYIAAFGILKSMSPVPCGDPTCFSCEFESAESYADFMMASTRGALRYQNN